MLDFDELAAAAPEWYAELGSALAREKLDDAARILQENVAHAADAEEKLIAALASAKVQCAKPDQKSAKRKAQEALTLAQAFGEQSLEAAALHRLAKARLLGSGEDVVDARNSAQEALEMYRSAGDKLGEASVLVTLAKALLPVDHEQAQRFANEASHMFKLSNERRGQATAMHVLFSLMLQQGRLHNAVVVIEEMSRCYKTGKDEPNMCTCRLLASQVLLTSGKYREATAAAEECLGIAEALGDEKKMGAAVFLMASIMESRLRSAPGMQQVAEAKAYEAWSYMRHLRDKRGMAASLEILARCVVHRGEFANAIQKLQEAAFLYRHLKDVRMEARALLSICEVMSQDSSKKSPEEELLPVEHSMVAVELYKQLGDAGEDGCIAALLAAAAAFSKVEPSNEAAIMKAREAMRLSRESSRPSSELKAMLALAQYQLGAHHKVDGQKTATDALAMAERLGDEDGIQAAQTIIDGTQEEDKKKRPAQAAPRAEYTEIDIIRSDYSGKAYKFAEFKDFESRVARHMQKKEVSSYSSLREEDIETPSNADVLYDLQWKNVTKDLISLPTPLDEIIQSAA